MKPTLSAFYIFCLVLTIYSCRQSKPGTLDYEKLNHDTNRISIFKWDTAVYIFPNNSDPLPLTQEDLFTIDSFLKDAIDTFNITISSKLYQAFDGKVPIDSFIIKKEKYKHQFFPYRDVNGQRIVAIIGFYDNFYPWKTKIYFGKQHYGMRKTELKVN